jgi:hypothetical protein
LKLSLDPEHPVRPGCNDVTEIMQVYKTLNYTGDGALHTVYHTEGEPELTAVKRFFHHNGKYVALNGLALREVTAAPDRTGDMLSW